MLFAQIVERLSTHLSEDLSRDLLELSEVTDNLAHGNGFGAKTRMEKLCSRKGLELLPNNLVKGERIRTMGEVIDLMKKIQSGEAMPIKVTKESDLLDGNFVWTKSCRPIYLRLCAKYKTQLLEKL